MSSAGDSEVGMSGLKDFLGLRIFRCSNLGLSTCERERERTTPSGVMCCGRKEGREREPFWLKSEPTPGLSQWTAVFSIKGTQIKVSRAGELQ